MKSKIEARVSYRFAATAEQVYAAWLDPAAVKVWLSAALQSWGLPGEMQRIEIDARVGGRFFFSDLRNGTEARHWGEYRELVCPTKIVFTWIVDEKEEADPSQVSLTIQPDGEGCVATLVHEMDAAWSAYLSRTEAGWSRMLEQIAKYLG